MQLFRNNSIDSVSFEDTAKKADLARPRISVYFKSKSDLTSALLEEIHPILLSKIEESIASRSMPREKIEAYLQANFKIVESIDHGFVF